MEEKPEVKAPENVVAISKLIKLLKRRDYSILLVEHRDRLTRFGFNYILRRAKRKTEKIIKEIVDEKGD